MAKKRKIPFDPKSATMNVAAAVFGLSRRHLYRMADAGAPRNSDGSFDLPALFAWRLAKETEKMVTPGSLKEQKLQAEIKYKTAQIEKVKENFIERSLHETILCSRAGSLRRFLEKSFVNNAVYLVGKNVDEMRALLLDLATQCMDVYVGKRRPTTGGQG